MFDHRKLIGKIIEVCKTQTEFGKRMGWSHTTTSAKVNSNKAWTQDEIIKATEILMIETSEIPLYFFTVTV